MLFPNAFMKKLRNSIMLMSYQKQPYHHDSERFKSKQKSSHQTLPGQSPIGSNERMKTAFYFTTIIISSNFFIVVVEMNSIMLHFVKGVMAMVHVWCWSKNHQPKFMEGIINLISYVAMV